MDGIISALSDINALNAKKKRDTALALLEKWLPQAERFTAQIKTVDGYVKSLESENRYQKNRNDDIQQTLVAERSGAKDKEWFPTCRKKNRKTCLKQWNPRTERRATHRQSVCGNSPLTVRLIWIPFSPLWPRKSPIKKSKSS
jgi:hypothetical protein